MAHMLKVAGGSVQGGWFELQKWNGTHFYISLRQHCLIQALSSATVSKKNVVQHVKEPTAHHSSICERKFSIAWNGSQSTIRLAIDVLNEERYETSVGRAITILMTSLCDLLLDPPNLPGLE